ncbi:hypothetical protein CB0940_04306 [Cercospora beticola]|uniref:F-box domain-containing protein n=2 Tax=Cercospora beticola TaxID=122368 RepID=A0A2G5HMH7_CERBT|nr:hypothetical protein CB0940_04306 [Cercospora beticola]PIA93422.1 hypothetical protein CB0940_04306 [Cercospora beticola]CAK1363673.1 unnamed protein product [Cercospora beticola]
MTSTRHRRQTRLSSKLPRIRKNRLKMEVVSIKDFEREEINELDYVLHSAVDQLVALTHPKDYLASLNDLVYHFGTLNFGEEGGFRRFGFSLPSTCPQWPGPRFGSFSLHKVIAKVHSKPRSRKGQSVGAAKAVSSPRLRPKPPKTKVTCNFTAKGGAALVRRSPPLCLLNLPPEIRNSVWNLLAVRKDPVEAQLRRIQPCKKLTPHRKTVIRRFPQEPLAASANKQMRREILSIFYGTNRFIFERNACSMFADLSMLSPPNIMTWKPRADVAGFLTSVELRFNALPRTLSMAHIVYAMRRGPEGSTTIEVKTEKTGKQKKKCTEEQYCLCHEFAVAQAVSETASKNRELDLAGCALNVVRKRHDTMFAAPVMQNSKSGNFYPPNAVCDRCEKATFEIVYSGV